MGECPEVLRQRILSALRECFDGRLRPDWIGVQRVADSLIASPEWQAAWNSRAPSKAERDGVLEEAAKVCDERHIEAAQIYGGKRTEYQRGRSDMADGCAHAIRAMKGRP